MADYRYIEAWKRNSSAMKYAPKSSSTKTPAAAAPSSAVHVRLDTPGGVTYSPDEFNSHNVVKRLFIPYKLGEDSRKKEEAEIYDFDKDLREEIQAQGDTGDTTDEEGVSEARKYAMSIDFDALAKKREDVLRDGRDLGDIDEEADLERADPYRFDAMTISGQSRMSTASKASTSTMTTVSAAKKDGSLPDWFTRTSAHKDVVPFVVPPRLTGRPQDHKQPWAAMRWHGHRAFDRPSLRENENGIAAFEDVNGPGRAPSITETRSGSDDASSIMTDRTATKSSARSLTVADLFVVDPRRSRALRIVRRRDPRQVLLLCNGVYLPSSHIATSKAAQAAQKSGVDLKELIKTHPAEAQKMLASVSSYSQARGGIGVIYCPHEDVLSQDEEALKEIDERIDVNCAKRLEVPPELTELTEKRAQLRAALAAVELANWEEEGFDKIVIGVEQDWIVRGISNDIWQWKRNGWTTPIGESVPDRDLWELIDRAIEGYEKIDCNVRFWQVSSKDARMARNLAEIGAMKDLQRPQTVRWRRKTPSVIKVDKKESSSHQGPVLSSVR